MHFVLKFHKSLKIQILCKNILFYEFHNFLGTTFYFDH